MGGVVFAYMGPAPAPLLPRVDVLVWPGVRRTQSIMIPCNWLQCHENSLDPLHFQWLHRYWGGWVMNRNKPPEMRDLWHARLGSRGAEVIAVTGGHGSMIDDPVTTRRIVDLLNE